MKNKKIQITAIVAAPTLFMLLLGLVLMVTIAGAFGGSAKPVTDNNFSAAVESYRLNVTEIAKENDMPDYVDLILCIMQVESGGSGNDPMQSSEGSFNKKYPQIPNGIKDPIYSIECGVKELKDCLQRAGVKDSSDSETIRVALAGYNFGIGYIEWCQSKYGGKWSLKNAQEFSDIWKNKLGWASYGDPPYADNVMNYYQTGNDGASLAAIGSAKYKRLITEAEKYIGMPYVWGGATPQTSFDCSGYISWVYTGSGLYYIPRTTAQGIYNMTKKVSEKEAKPGDLIFFTQTYNCEDPVSHIAIYVGNGRMLHCGNPIGYVNIDNYWQSHFYAYGRLPITK